MKRDLLLQFAFHLAKPWKISPSVTMIPFVASRNLFSVLLAPKKGAPGQLPIPSMPEIDWTAPHPDDLLFPDREYNIPMGPGKIKKRKRRVKRDPFVDSKGRPWPDITWSEFNSDNFDWVEKLKIPEYHDPFLVTEGRPKWTLRRWLSTYL